MKKNMDTLNRDVKRKEPGESNVIDERSGELEEMGKVLEGVEY